MLISLRHSRLPEAHQHLHLVTVFNEEVFIASVKLHTGGV